MVEVEVEVRGVGVQTGDADHQPLLVLQERHDPRRWAPVRIGWPEAPAVAAASPNRRRPRMSRDRRAEAAAVLPIDRDGRGALRLVLIIQARHGRHGGQVSLPGGRREPGDASLRETALREARRELGGAREELTVLARLDPVKTLTAGFTVWPSVARLAAPIIGLRPEPLAVAEGADLAVADLVDPAGSARRR